MKKRLSGVLTMVITLSLTLGSLVFIMPVASAVGVNNNFTATFEPTNAQKFLVLTFTNPVCGDPLCATALTADDFTYVNATGTGSDGFTAISSANHAAGSRYVVLVMDAASTANDAVNDTIYAKAGAVWSID
ncbi:MAG: hypothetical protein V1715_11185, partial [bacterium]